MKLEKETRLKLAIGLSSTFCVVEVIGGYVANSIAIYSDAAHLLTDIAGFGIALLAVIASKAPGTKHLTYGFARAEVFGALGSIASLWVITAFLLYAAYTRAFKWFEGHGEVVNGFLMFCVACFGVCVNICLGLVFQEEHGGAMHPSHSHCTHDHSHDGSHGHSHGHDDHGSCKGHGTTYQLLAVNDVEAGRNDHDHDHGHSSHSDHSSCSGHDHGHGHSSHGATDKTKLLSGSNKSYNSNDDHGHDHDHDAGHDHSTCSGHSHGGHDHSSGGCSGHGHDDHDHSSDYHGAEETQKTFIPSDVNIEAAYLHVLTDLIQSIGVAIAGLIIWFKPHWQIIDPVCTFIFSFIALKTTIPLLIRVFGILLEGTPSHVDWEIVRDKLIAIPGVEEVHDLHIWSISSKSVSLTVHIKALNPQQVLKEAHKICAELSIDHATIQVQDASDADFCFSKGCDSHNPDSNVGGSSCVRTNSVDSKSSKSPRGN